MLEFFRQHEIGQIYLYELLQKMSLGLIGIFIPIFIATNGLNLAWAFGFLVIQSLSFMVLAVPVSYIIAKIGFKHSLVVSYLFYLPGLAGFQVFDLTPMLVTGSAVLIALGKAFHWIALHSEFAVDSHRSSREKQTGRMLGFPRIARALAPVTGGAIMAVYGFHALVSASVFFLVLSAVPLMASKDHRDPLDYSLKSLVDRKHLVFGSLFFLRGVSSATGKYLFPIFVFTVIGGTFNAGAVSSLTNLGSMLLALFLGRVASRNRNESLMIVVGAVSSGILFVLRGFVSTPFEAFYISLSAGLLFMIYFIPVFSDQADAAEDEDVLEFFAFREVFLGLGRITVLGAGLYLVLAGDSLGGLRLAFYLAGLATAAIALYTPWLSRLD